MIENIYSTKLPETPDPLSPRKNRFNSGAPLPTFGSHLLTSRPKSIGIPNRIHLKSLQKPKKPRTKSLPMPHLQNSPYMPVGRSVIIIGSFDPGR